jgi:hypothetical protein
LLKGGIQIKAQNDIVLFGDMVNKDTVLYYFDNDKENLNIVHGDESGKYTLSVKSKKAKTITFYLKKSDYCSQTLNLTTIKKQAKVLKNNKVQNDLSVMNGFACFRFDDCGVSQDVLKKFMGKWIDKNKSTIELTCDYRRKFIEGGMKFFEEGEWSGNENQIELRSEYIKNIETGTYLNVRKKLALNYNDGQLIPVGKEIGYVKER